MDPHGQPAQFARCTAALVVLPLPMVSTWPCLAEAMHLTGRDDGGAMQSQVADYITRGLLRLHTPTPPETARILALMARYADRPMDLADASLVALAETDGYTRVFSLDGDFYVYRLADGRALEVVPGPLPRAPRR